MKTREEVEQLKQAWLRDDIWDIYETEGFEEYREELVLFQLNTAKEWRAKEYNRVFTFAESLAIHALGSPNEETNLSLARYLMALEGRIKQLEEQ